MIPVQVSIQTEKIILFACSQNDTGASRKSLLKDPDDINSSLFHCSTIKHPVERITFSLVFCEQKEENSAFFIVAV